MEKSVPNKLCDIQDEKKGADVCALRNVKELKVNEIYRKLCFLFRLH